MTVVSGTCRQILALFGTSSNSINESSPLAAPAVFVRSNSYMLNLLVLSNIAVGSDNQYCWGGQIC